MTTPIEKSILWRREDLALLMAALALIGKNKDHYTDGEQATLEVITIGAQSILETARNELGDLEEDIARTIAEITEARAARLKAAADVPEPPESDET